MEFAEQLNESVYANCARSGQAFCSFFRVIKEMLVVSSMGPV